MSHGATRRDESLPRVRLPFSAAEEAQRAVGGAVEAGAAPQPVPPRTAGRKTSSRYVPRACFRSGPGENLRRIAAKARALQVSQGKRQTDRQSGCPVMESRSFTAGDQQHSAITRKLGVAE